jgi:hypothetical protein
MSITQTNFTITDAADLANDINAIDLTAAIPPRTRTIPSPLI